MANGWEDFGFGNESFGNVNYDWTLDPAASVSFNMDDAYHFQGFEQPAIQEEQPSQETQQQHAGQQELDEDAQFVADMQALIDFNAQN